MVARPKRCRFGEFEFDLAARELRCRGRRVEVQMQPLQVLEILLVQAGTVVHKAEIARTIWGELSAEQYEPNLAQDIRKLRHALADDAREPRFIETLPRRGYRYVGPPPEFLDDDRSGKERPPPAAPRAFSGGASNRRWLVWAVVLISITLGSAGVYRFLRWASQGGVSSGSPESFHVSFDSLATSPQSLERRGFRVLNPDTERWPRQGDLLRLSTLRGDIWRKPTDPNLPVRNVVARRVSQRRFQANTKIVDFHPQNDWQQAGILVLEDEEMQNYARLTFGHDSNCPAPHRAIQAMLKIRDEEDFRAFLQCVDLRDQAWLQIRRDGNNMRFSYREKGFDVWQSLWEVEASLDQELVGLAAFQGVTLEPGEPIDHEPVEADFECFSLTGLRTAAD